MADRVAVHVADTPLPSRRLQFGLGSKILLSVVCVSLIGVIASSFLVLTLQRQQLIVSAQKTAMHVSDTLEAGLEHAMLNNDRAMAAQTIQAVVREGEINRVRILDARGMVRVSSNSVEVGLLFNRTEPVCQSCHIGGPASEDQRTILVTKDGRETLLDVNVIRNQSQCAGCHSSQTPVLGLLMTEMPLTDLGSQREAAFWRLGLSALVTFALLGGLLVLALRRWIAQPVQELAAAAAAVGAGQLDYPVRVTGRDELGTLADAFHRMQQQLKASQTDMERRHRELALLNEVAVAATQLLDVVQIADLVLDTVIFRLGMQAGSVYLRDESTGRVTHRACRGLSDAQCQELERRWQQPSGALPPQPAQTDAEVVVVDMEADAGFQGLWDNMQGRSCVNLLLKAKGRVMGTLWLVTYPKQPLTQHEVEVLKAVGREISIAIDNALLLAKTHHLAALEERDRLAREIHDGLAQALGYLNLKASITDELLAASRVPEARASLHEMKQIVREAYADAREGIFSLRTATSAGLGFLPTLREYLDEYRARHGIRTRLEAEGETQAWFPPGAEVQILRIIQEALTNVRKHAEAKQVWVRFAWEGEHVRITVEDDGCGFDPARVEEKGRRYFGLQIMRERAESVGGSLELDSWPGGGTRVVVQMPI